MPKIRAMVELSVRLLLSGAVVFAAGLLARGEFAVLAGVAALHAAGTFLLGRLEARGFGGPRLASFVAIADGGLAGFVLSRFGPSPTLLAALAPIVPLAAGLRLSLVPSPSPSPSAGRGTRAAAVLGGTVAGAFAFAAGSPSAATAATVGGVALALALESGRRTALPAPPVEPGGEEDEVLVELRLAFRKLRAAYRELERTSRRDRVIAGLSEARGDDGDALERVAERLRKLAGAEGLVLYTLAQYDEALTVAAAAGVVNDRQRREPLEVRVRHAAGALREEADLLLQAMRGEGHGVNVPLLHQGVVLGFLAASVRAPDPHVSEVLEGAAPAVAALLAENARRQTTERRAKEAELLYGLANATDGATTPAEVAARATRDLREILGADHVALSLVQDGRLDVVGGDGKPAPLLEEMTFAGGAGVAGWLAAGAPEIALADVRRDPRCSPEGALKSRIAAFCAVPLRLADGALAVLTAASARVGGLDLPQMETLRAAAAELGRRLSRPFGEERESEGLLLPSEFAGRLLRGGALVTLDPQRIEAHEANFGAPAVSHALRTLATRVRARLPHGAAACRTPEGRLLVWLPDGDQSAAAAWANETAAAAAGFGLRTPDGARLIPIGLKAKVAALEPGAASASAVVSAPNVVPAKFERVAA